MAEARSRHDWNQTALLACFLYNPHRKSGSPALGPEAFSPYHQRAAARKPDIELSAKEGIALLKDLFTGRRHGG